MGEWITTWFYSYFIGFLLYMAIAFQVSAGRATVPSRGWLRSASILCCLIIGWLISRRLR